MLLEEVRKGEDVRKQEIKEKLDELTQEQERIATTRDKAYLDKLNGVIEEERWASLDNEWGERLNLIVEKANELREALKSSGAEELDSTLELLKRARELFSQQDPFEQAEGLKILVSNLTITGRKLDPDYRSPFDLVALGTKTGNWYPRQDSNLWPTV